MNQFLLNFMWRVLQIFQRKIHKQLAVNCKPVNFINADKHFDINIQEIFFYSLQSIYILNLNLNCYNRYISKNMSNYKPPTDQPYQNAIFSHTETPYQHFKSSIDQSRRQPLKQSQFSKNYAHNFKYSSTGGKDNIQNLRFNSIFTPRQRPKISIEQLLDEIKKLNEIICNLGRDNEMLQEEYNSLQFQMNGQIQKELKDKQTLQSDIRLLKEMLNDKISERQSCEKTGRKEKQLIQQQCQRLRHQIKLVIEKKNDEIFSITREKDSQNQSLKRNFQNQIQQLKKQHKNTISSFQAKNQESEQEIHLLKQKQNNLLGQIDKITEKNEQEKLKKLEQHEDYVNELKSKYHQSKMILIQTGKQEILQMEKRLKIQEDMFLSEIQQLHLAIQRQQKQNENNKEMMKTMGDQYESRVQGYESMIEELEIKLKKVYQQKNQQIQIIKVKIASLHTQDLKNIQSISSSKINFLSNKVKNLQQQIQNLHQLLDLAYQKNLDLIRQKEESDSKASQQIVKIQLANRSTEKFMKDKMQAQQISFTQQIEQAIKTNEIKSNQISTYEKELDKLRKITDQKVSDIQQLEKQLNAKQILLNSERQKFKSQIHKSNKEWQEINQIQKQEINLKNQEIQKLNKEIHHILSQRKEPDVIKYEGEIDRLQKQLRDKVEAQKDFKYKLQSYEQKICELNQEQNRIHEFASAIAEQAKSEWQVLSSQKVLQIEQLYQKKLQFLQNERDQLKQINSSHLIHINSLTIKQQELQANLRQIMESLERKSEFQNKIIQLGQDNNLVKNKQELFQY